MGRRVAGKEFFRNHPYLGAANNALVVAVLCMGVVLVPFLILKLLDPYLIWIPFAVFWAAFLSFFSYCLWRLRVDALSEGPLDKPEDWGLHP